MGTKRNRTTFIRMFPLFYDFCCRGAYLGFDYSATALNELFNVASDSFWTIATSTVGAGLLGAAPVYGVAKLAQSYLFSAKEEVGSMEQNDDDTGVELHSIASTASSSTS